MTYFSFAELSESKANNSDFLTSRVLEWTIDMMSPANQWATFLVETYVNVSKAIIYISHLSSQYLFTFESFSKFPCNLVYMDNVLPLCGKEIIS